MILAKSFNPEMFDEPQNVFKLDFKAAFLHDWEVDSCGPKICHNPFHYRLLDLDKQVEVTDSFNRIDAMGELWHGK